MSAIEIRQELHDLINSADDKSLKDFYKLAIALLEKADEDRIPEEEGGWALDEKILDLALISDFNDFEDAIQYFTALENGCEVIITRNKKDFRNVLLPVMTADEFIKF